MLPTLVSNLLDRTLVTRHAWRSVLILVLMFTQVSHQTQGQRSRRGNNSSRASSSRSTPLTSDSTASVPSEYSQASFAIVGLTSPATVSDTIFVSVRGVPAGATVSYTLDNDVVGTSALTPYWLGDVANDVPQGFNLNRIPAGQHVLGAKATLLDGSVYVSPDVVLSIVPSINDLFSNGLAPYSNHVASLRAALPDLLSRTTTSQASLPNSEVLTRSAVLAMYQNWGLDPSLDSGSDQSELLRSLVPQGAAASAPNRSSVPPSMWLSPDASFYHAIPAQWPRVALPQGYLHQVQFSTAYQGDGIGFGETIAQPSDPVLPVVSQWYDNISTRTTVPFRMTATWEKYLPTLPQGDRHLIFIDPETNTFLSGYKVSRDSSSGGPVALYAAKPTSFDSLGSTGGSIAAGFAELPALVQAGEATDPTREIPHAIGGSVSRVWAARVFPAISWDTGVLTSMNSCTGNGFTNTGLVPYGGIIQLDPQLDLSTLGLSLPARRILRAMQVYGFYVMDFGCTDLDVFTAMNANEIAPFGGPWGNRFGPGVQSELQKVLTTRTLYVVPPPMKKQ